MMGVLLLTVLAKVSLLLFGRPLEESGTGWVAGMDGLGIRSRIVFDRGGHDRN